MTEKGKLVLIIASSIGGGAQKLLIDIAPYLNEFYQIKIICPSGYLSEKLLEVGMIPEISEVNLRTLRKIKKDILKWANGEPFTVNPYLFGTAFYMTIIFGKIKNCKIVSLLLNPIVRDGMSQLKKILYKLIARQIGRKSDSIAVGSPELADEVYRYSGQKAHYLENRVPNIAHPKERMYDATDGKPLKICFAGRMAEQKRPDIFALTAKLTRDANLNVRYYMAGEGPLKEKIMKYVTDNGLLDIVSFLGFVDDLYVFLSEMDVLMCTSEFENTPLIILNAMNAGLPVIAGQVVGIPHLINNGVDGILADEFSPEGFSDAIVHIVNYPEIYCLLSTNAYNKAITEFSYKDFVEKYRKILIC